MKSIDSKKKNSTPIKKYLALFAFLFVAALVVFFDHFTEEPFSLEELKVETHRPQEKADVGFQAPGFRVKNLEGNYVRLSRYRGRVVLLNFWATWCAPCRVEMPSFETLYRRYRTEGLTVLALSLDKGPVAPIREFVDKYQLSFPVLLDREGEAEKLYPTVTIPYTFVIDRSGRVVARVDGAKNWESQDTFEAVEYLLRQKPPESARVPAVPR